MRRPVQRRARRGSPVALHGLRGRGQKSCGAPSLSPCQPPTAPHGLSTSADEMEDRHDDDDDGFGAGSHDAPADGDLDPALDPSLVDSPGGEDNGSAARHASQLPSASAAHELADALDDGTGHGSLDDGSSSHTLPQAFWDALPLGDSMVRLRLSRLALTCGPRAPKRKLTLALHSSAIARPGPADELKLAHTYDGGSACRHVARVRHFAGRSSRLA